MLNDVLSSQILRFELLRTCSSRNHVFEAIRSCEAKVDVSCEIVVNDALSSQIARFQLFTSCRSLNRVFEDIRSFGPKVDICEYSARSRDLNCYA